MTSMQYTPNNNVKNDLLLKTMNSVDNVKSHEEEGVYKTEELKRQQDNKSA